MKRPDAAGGRSVLWRRRGRRGGAAALTLVLLLALEIGAQTTVGTPRPEGDPRAARWRAWAADGRWDDVIEEASRVVDETPGDRDAHDWLGQAWLARAEELLASGQSAFVQDLAHASLSRAIEHLDRAAQGSDAAAARARELSAYARYLRADEGLAAELELWFGDEDARGRAYAAYLRGHQLQAAGDPAGASAWFERAAALDPGRAEFSLAWSSALAGAGRREDALAAWDDARRVGAQLDSLLASLLAILPERSDAPRRLERLALLKTDDVDDWVRARVAWHRSHSLQQLGRLEEAATVLAQATEPGLWLDVDRDHAGVLRGLGRPSEAVAILGVWVARGESGAVDDLVDLADAAALARDDDVALDAYERVLSVEPGHERARANRALTLSRFGRDGALAAWDELVARHPGRADLLNDAALTSWGGGRVMRAKALWERAILLAGSDDARENLAAALLEEDPQRARELLDAILSRNPERDRALYLRHLTGP